jgi:hypothetical protein
MTISYPLAMPTVANIRSIELTATNAVSYSRSPFTFAGQAQEFAGKMWQATVTLPAMKRAAAEEWISFLIALRGQVGTFNLGDPMAETPRGSARNADNISINGALTSGSEIVMDGGVQNQTGYLKAGDYLQIGTGPTQQLFKVLADANTNGTGQITVDVWPNVRTSIANDALVTVQSAKGIFRLQTNETVWNINEMAVYGITFAAIEAI